MLKIFSVYDQKAEFFSNPYYDRTTAAGIRQFEAAVNDPGSRLFAAAADYTLFELGEFDEQSGSFHLHDAAANLGNGLALQSPGAAGQPEVQ